MRQAIYRVVVTSDGYGIEHDGKTSGPYATREAAFEAAVGPASNSIRDGFEVRIEVPRGTAGSAHRSG